jgi:hypothetical protein
VAHTACFIVSVSLISAQSQYITEVDDAGNAVITLHRMAIDCRCGSVVWVAWIKLCICCGPSDVRIVAPELCSDELS